MGLPTLSQNVWALSQNDWAYDIILTPRGARHLISPRWLGGVHSLCVCLSLCVVISNAATLGLQPWLFRFWSA